MSVGTMVTWRYLVDKSSVGKDQFKWSAWRGILAAVFPSAHGTMDSFNSTASPALSLPCFLEWMGDDWTRSFEVVHILRSREAPDRALTRMILKKVRHRSWVKSDGAKGCG